MKKFIYLFIYFFLTDCVDDTTFRKNGLTCSQLVTLEPPQCYNDDVAESCCRSCADAAYGKPGKNRTV